MALELTQAISFLETIMCVYIVSSLYLVFKCGKTTQLKKHPKILALEMRLSNYA